MFQCRDSWGTSDHDTNSESHTEADALRAAAHCRGGGPTYDINDLLEGEAEAEDEGLGLVGNRSFEGVVVRQEVRKQTTFVWTLFRVCGERNKKENRRGTMLVRQRDNSKSVHLILFISKGYKKSSRAQ